MVLIFKYLSTLTFILETNLQLMFKRSQCLRSRLCLERPLLRLIALFNHDRHCSSTKCLHSRGRKSHSLPGYTFVLSATFCYSNYVYQICGGRGALSDSENLSVCSCLSLLSWKLISKRFLFPCLQTGRPPGAHRPLPDCKRQPSSAAASLHCAGPQARVGALQRVRTHDQELHSHVHGHQTRVVRNICSSFIQEVVHCKDNRCLHVAIVKCEFL